MRLLVLMYHRARAGRHGNSPAMLDAHFRCVADRYGCVLPGEPLTSGRLNVCLTFDDAYYDFYAVVYPLLIKHGLRALLAVPSVVVREKAFQDHRIRLAAEPGVDATNASCGGFCTWPELQEMTAGDRIAIASHGFTHQALRGLEVDLETEIDVSQTLLESRLGKPVESLVFPFGSFDRRSLQRARQSHRHVFRIGGADNRGWSEPLLYRVDADGLAVPDEPFSARRLARYRVRRWWNRLRGK